MTAIETRGLSKRYRKVHALRDLDLSVPDGTVCGFLGPNGAGKTTTMRILMGLSRPTAGDATLLGHAVAGSGPAIRSRVGYLSQDPSFYPRFKVSTVLRFVAGRYLSGSKSALDDRVDETLELVGLTDRADRRVKALSGGERQRLGIGQAVIGGPDLLILDEPSVGLDPEGRYQVLNLIHSLRDRMTIFYSSHILDDVERIADHVVILAGGQLVEQGPMERFIEAGTGYHIEVDGDGDSARTALRDRPWVTNVSADGNGALDIRVADRAAAERELLPLLAASTHARVTEMRPVARNLEEIYLEVVGAADGD